MGCPGLCPWVFADGRAVAVVRVRRRGVRRCILGVGCLILVGIQGVKFAGKSLRGDVGLMGRF